MSQSRTRGWPWIPAVLSVALAIAVVPARGVAQAAPLPPEIVSLIGEIDAGSLPERSPEQWQQLFESAIRALMPGMGAAALPDREAPQQALDRIARFMSSPQTETQRAAFSTAAMKLAAEDGPIEARVWLLRQIERTGRGECVPQLAAILAGADQRLAECARRALQHNSSEEAAEALREGLLAAQDEPWQIALVNALGARRDGTSVELIQRVELTPEATIALRGACHAALADIATPQALDTLVALWREGGDSQRIESVTGALLRAANAAVIRGDKEIAAEQYTALFNSAASLAIRRGALRGLVQVGGRKNLALVAEVALERHDAGFSSDALRFLEERPTAYVARILIGEAKTGAPALRARLFESLGRRGDAEARPYALEALSDPDEHVRIAAAGALSAFGFAEDAVALAETAAAAPDDAQRAKLRAALDEMRGGDTDAVIVEHITTGTVGVRVESARTAAARRSPGASLSLFKATEADEDEVRVAAIEALGKVADPSELHSLVQVLMRARSDASRRAAEDAVVAVVGRVADVEHRADEVIAGFRVADPAVDPSFIRVLGRIGGGKALSAVREGAASGREPTVDAAVRALAAWATIDALPDLKNITESSENETRRVLALRGFIRLARADRDSSAAETIDRLDWAAAKAMSDDHRKLVVAALGDVGTRDSLERLHPHLSEAALKNEAASSIVKVASALAGEDPAAALAALDSAAASAPPQAVTDRVQAARKRITDHAGYVGVWDITEPYFEEGLGMADLVDHAFAPETGEAEFRPLEFRGDDNPWEVDLARMIGGSNRCVYLRAQIEAPEARSVVLKIGSDDGVKVWWNGAEVHKVDTVRALSCGQDSVNVELGAGVNTVMLKVVQAAGGCGACCAIFDTDGKAIEGLRFGHVE